MWPGHRGGPGVLRTGPGIYAQPMSELTVWEYATVPLLTHATKAILDQWGSDGWELVSVLPGPTGEQHVAYLKRPKN